MWKDPDHPRKTPNILGLSSLAAILLLLSLLSCAAPLPHEQLTVARKPNPSDELRLIGNRYAIVVGVGKYRNTRLPNLPTPLDDATDVAALLERAGFGVSLIADEKRSSIPISAIPDNATALRGVIAQVARQMAPQDLLLFYFSGHGIHAANQDYLLFRNTDPNRPHDNALSVQQLASLMDSLHVDKRILIVDACRSTGIKAPPFEGFSLEAMRDWRGTAVLSATDSGQVARPPFPGETDTFTGELIRHSIYTHFLLRGLRGEADTPHTDGFLTLTELAGFADRCMRHQDPQQVPQSRLDGLGGDIYLAKVAQPTMAASSRGHRRVAEARSAHPPAIIEQFLPDTYEGVESFDGSLLRRRGVTGELVWSTTQTPDSRPYIQFLENVVKQYGTLLRIERAWIAYRRDRSQRTLVFVADRSLWEVAKWERESGWLTRMMGERSNKVADYHGIKYTTIRIFPQFDSIDQGYEVTTGDDCYFYCELGGYGVVVRRLIDLQEVVDLFQGTRGRLMNESPTLGEQLAYVDGRSAFWQCALVNEAESVMISAVLGLKKASRVQRLSVWYDENRDTRGHDRVSWGVVLMLESDDQAVTCGEALRLLKRKWEEGEGVELAGMIAVERPSARCAGISGVLIEQEIALLEDLIRAGRFSVKWAF